MIAPALSFSPDLVAIERVILAIEDGARASRDLDAAAFEALGWRVQRDRQMVLSPLSRTALPLPRASRRTDCAALVVPARWDWSAGMRAGRATAWCRSPHPEGHPGSLWFEANSPALPALALLRAGLHAQRAILLREIETARRIPADRWSCDGCGWFGPRDAGRGGACPDCQRMIHEAA